MDQEVKVLPRKQKNCVPLSGVLASGEAVAVDVADDDDYSAN